MPRLRRKRDYDWEPTDEDFPEARGDAETLEDSGDVSHPFEGVEGDSDSGASWLSNAVIIGSLSDHKLHAALARYRAIVRLCEAELSARAIAPRRHPNERKLRDDSDVTVARQSRKRGVKRALKTQSPKAVTLPPEALAKALLMLIQLKKDKTNDTMVKDVPTPTQT